MESASSQQRLGQDLFSHESGDARGCFLRPALSQRMLHYWVRNGLGFFVQKVGVFAIINKNKLGRRKKLMTL